MDPPTPLTIGTVVTVYWETGRKKYWTAEIAEPLTKRKNVSKPKATSNSNADEAAAIDSGIESSSASVKTTDHQPNKKNTQGTSTPKAAKVGNGIGSLSSSLSASSRPSTPAKTKRNQSSRGKSSSPTKRLLPTGPAIRNAGELRLFITVTALFT